MSSNAFILASYEPISHRVWRDLSPGTTPVVDGLVGGIHGFGDAVDIVVHEVADAVEVDAVVLGGGGAVAVGQVVEDAFP